MPEKPSTAEGYLGHDTEKLLQMFQYLRTRLGNFQEDLILVGGLVPFLLVDYRKGFNAPPDDFSQTVANFKRHVGSLDVDLGIRVGIFDKQKYEELESRLKNSGFSPVIDSEGKKLTHRWVDEHDEDLTIDFAIEPPDDAEPDQTFFNLTGDLGAVTAPGLEEAEKDHIRLDFDYSTLDREQTTEKIKVSGPASFIVQKALAFEDRGYEKDAYDLFYVLRNFGSEDDESSPVNRVLQEFSQLEPFSERVDSALEVLKEDFTTEDSKGATRVANFVIGETPRTGTEEGLNQHENVRVDVTAFVKELLEKL